MSSHDHFNVVIHYNSKYVIEHCVKIVMSCTPVVVFEHCKLFNLATDSLIHVMLICRTICTCMGFTLISKQ